jgi:hypothetical protein
MKFITNWTVDVEKVPAYVDFKQDFKEHVDYNLANLILECGDVRLTPEIKTEFKKLVERVDKKTNLLSVKYNSRYGLGRRYPDYPVEKLPNGLVNPNFKKYYSALIAQPRLIKNTLFNYSNWVDIDQVKGHATIIMDMAIKNKVSLPSYADYLKVGRFDEIVRELSVYYSVEDEPPIDKKDIKWLFNKTIYGGGHSKWCEDIQAGGFSKDGKEICKRIPKEMKNTKTPHPIYNKFFEDTQKIIGLVYLNNTGIRDKVCLYITGGEEEDWKRKNRVMSYFCGIIENEITFKAYKYLLGENIIQKGFVDWGLDGITFPMPEGNVLNNVLIGMNESVRKSTGFKNVAFVIKPFEEEDLLLDLIDKRNEEIIVVNEEVLSEENEEEEEEDEIFDNETSFESISKKFELTHCKILNKACFIRNTVNEVILMSKQQIITAYENMIYEKEFVYNGKVKTVSANFIGDWIKNNPSQLCYEEIGCYPDSKSCPHNHFNTWKPFDMERVTGYEPKPDSLKIIRKHILILCGNDSTVATYFEAWIAQMIQYPAVKSVCPVLISKEGAGKGTLMRLLEKMLGNSKVFETATPSRDIWGDFNGRMASTFLVNLNELSKRETTESEGRIKALITDPRLTINNKGVNQYDINSYHRFIISTNKEEPINSSKDDRRNFIIRSSDELCGNKDYFTTLYELLEDVNVIKTCFEFFKTIEEMDEFNKLELPVTEYHQELKTLSISPIENWLKAFTLEYYYNKETHKELLGKEQYKLFKEWCKKCGIEYTITLQAFGIRLKRLNINGIDIGKHTNKGETKIFDIDKLKIHFKLNNVEVSTVTDEEELDIDTDI